MSGWAKFWAGILIGASLMLLIVEAWRQWPLVIQLLTLNRVALIDTGTVVLALPFIAIFVTSLMRRGRA